MKTNMLVTNLTSADPERLMVEDSVAEQTRIEAQGVVFSRTRGEEPWGGIISTFQDPDGNPIQLIEFHPPS